MVRRNGTLDAHDTTGDVHLYVSNSLRGRGCGPEVLVHWCVVCMVSMLLHRGVLLRRWCDGIKAVSRMSIR